MNLVLFGFKTCGKTTTGKLVAKKLNKTFVDVDTIIEDLYYNPLLGRPKKLSHGDIFRHHGEEFFRALERDAVRKMRLVKNGVIATGGGSVLDYYNHAELKKNGLLVYLKTPKEVIKKRMLETKPLPGILDPDDPEKSFERMYKERSPIYDKIADVVLDTEGISLENLADQVCSLARE
ncbi:MAG: shikimate kinase [Chlamydiales bacterium]|nr:shikimate kinase [Chlamydiales bacterium]